MKDETVNQWMEGLNKDAKTEKVFLTPIRDIILDIKLVEKDKQRGIKTPYVTVTIMIPQDIATTIPELMTSKWRLALFGMISKEPKRKKSK